MHPWLFACFVFSGLTWISTRYKLYLDRP